ncbi:unnamed protein product [Ilex paraguariensis]|uniref:Uncharacterized protein n=1 Tax=Ilex paraguariensis TaxID=185542 RepID=A0ABC8T682_9AQUA
MKAANALGIGAGHINPSLAADPGLIYEADGSDYTKFLCSLNYTIPDEVICAGTPANLNYPSFSVVFKHNNCIQENEKQSHTVKFESRIVGNNTSDPVQQIVFGHFSLESAKHIVRSPIAML